MKRIQIFENGINAVFEITDNKEPKLLHFSSSLFQESNLFDNDDILPYNLTRLELMGVQVDDGMERCSEVTTCCLKYKDFKDINNSFGRKLEITCRDDKIGLETVSHFQFYTNTRVVRAWAEVNNCGTEIRTINYFSPLILPLVENDGLLTKNKCAGACRCSSESAPEWLSYTVDEIADVPISSQNRHFPVGYLENNETKTILFWQLEDGNSWQWKIKKRSEKSMLKSLEILSVTPDEKVELPPEESFKSLYCDLCVLNGDFNEAAAEISKQRRSVDRKRSKDPSFASVYHVPSDLLKTDKDTEKLFQLIDAAEDIGYEYFCIDLGNTDTFKFPDRCDLAQFNDDIGTDKLSIIREYIRNKRLVLCAKINVSEHKVNSSFFDEKNSCSIIAEDLVGKSDGFILTTKNRDNFDAKPFDRLISELVRSYHFKYIILDFRSTWFHGDTGSGNICSEEPDECENACFSLSRCIIYNGGKTLTDNCYHYCYELFQCDRSRCLISEREIFRRDSAAAVNFSTLNCTQKPTFTLDLSSLSSSESIVFSMINAMFFGICHRGDLTDFDEKNRDLVKEGVSLYKRIRRDTASGTFFYPLGASELSDDWSVLGVKCADMIYLAVWRREGSKKCVFSLDRDVGEKYSISCVYPSSNTVKYEYCPIERAVSAEFEKTYSAAIFLLK